MSYECYIRRQLGGKFGINLRNNRNEFDFIRHAPREFKKDAFTPSNLEPIHYKTKLFHIFTVTCWIQYNDRYDLYGMKESLTKYTKDRNIPSIHIAENAIYALRLFGLNENIETGKTQIKKLKK